MLPAVRNVVVHSPHSEGDDGQGLGEHSVGQRLQNIIWLAVLLSLFAAIAIEFRNAQFQGVRQLLIATKITGALFGLMTGFALALRYYSLGNRFHLFVGLAFFVNGMADLIHGGLCLMGDHRSDLLLGTVYSKEQFIKDAFVSGQLLMGTTLALALILPVWLRRIEGRARETIRLSVIVLAITLLAALVSDRPIDPVSTISAAILFLTGLGYVWSYATRGELLSWWIAVSLGTNGIGQLMMLGAAGPDAALYFFAHMYKVLGFLFPLFGFLLYQNTIVLDYQKSQRELKAARDEALRATRAKSEFLANMSHELRTPLNGVIGMTGRLIRSGPTTEQREYLKTIQESAISLLGLLNGLLDFAKIEAGKLTLEESEFALKDTVLDALKPLTIAASDKGLHFEIRMGDTLPEWVRGDSVRLRQVLLNLVGNAVKFTERGRVLVSVEECERQNNRSRLQFVIDDSGIGIAEEKLVHIFEPFSQADGSTTRKFGGTGLGLAICAELAALMQATISVESKLNEGSRFVFTITLPVVEEPCASNFQPPIAVGFSSFPLPKTNRSRLVLVVEDNDVNRRLAAGLLEELGHRPVMAQTGLAAVELVRRYQFDLILMDLQMPDIDGVEAAEIIRQCEDETAASTPIIAVTAHVSDGDRRRCLEAGMDGYLTKPISDRELLEAIESVPIPTHGVLAANRELLMRQVRGNERLLSELVSVFARDWQGHRQELREAANRKDGRALAAAAHKLSGSIANFHSKPVVELCKEIERSGQADDVASVSRLLDILDHYVDRLLESLLSAEERATEPATMPS